MDIFLKNVAVLLGAGASFPAGVPLARGFVPAVEQYLATLPNPDSESLIEVFHRCCATIARAAGLKQEEIDIEQLYRAIDESLDFQFSAADGLTTRPFLTASRGIERLHYEIKRCILHHCWIANPDKTKFLDPIAGELRSQRQLPIVSMNYDNVIELFCSSQGIQYVDPVLHESPTGTTSIELIKLHGSVTWAIDKSGLPKRAAPYGPNAWKLMGALRSATLETPIIYPTPGKVPIQVPFASQVVRFQRLLFGETLEYCLAIGYSFRDRHVIDWFTAALRANRNLRIVLVNLQPEVVLKSLIERDPRTDWTRRVLKAPVGSVEEVANFGLARAIQEAEEIIARRYTHTAALRISPLVQLGDLVSNIRPTPNGDSLLISLAGENGRLEMFHLPTRRSSTLSGRLGQNRGIAASDDGRLFFVQNELWRSKLSPSVGLGVVKEVADGRNRVINRISISDVREEFAIRKLGIRSVAATNILRWPADLLWSSLGRELVVTESRGLAVIDPTSGEVRRIEGPPLTMNLHAIDLLDQSRILGLELGIAQSNSWSRLIEFDLFGFRATSAIFDLGLPRLFGLCVLPFKRILIAQAMPAPLGAILIYSNPPTQPPKRLSGFDFPNRLAFHPSWDYVICSDRWGLHRVSLSDLERTV